MPLNMPSQPLHVSPPASPPKVSIGMPIYNGEKFMRTALDSLLSQTFRDFELIISDNASTDLTAEICKIYASKDSRISYIRQPENRGPLFNFSFVLSKSLGKYFMWAAADDIWDKDYIRQCVSIIDNKADIGLCFSKYLVLSIKFPLLSMKQFPDMSFLLSDSVFDRINKFILLNASTSHKANAIYGLWRKDLVIQSLRFTKDIDPELFYNAMDIAILVYALSKYKFYQLDNILFYKTHNIIPAGSFLDKLRNKINKILKYNNVAFQKKKSSKIDKYIEVLRIALKAANIFNNDYEKVLQEKRKSIIQNSYLNNSYFNKQI
jgi:glycosyltransferase involved in cell wall biosynthesis